MSENLKIKEEITQIKINTCLTQVFIYNLELGDINLVIATDLFYYNVKLILDATLKIAENCIIPDEIIVRYFITNLKTKSNHVIILSNDIIL